MPVGGPGLVLLTLASIALLLVLILVVKLHAFLALLVWSLARESKRSLLFFGMPVIAALSATHSLVPPHPAPSAAAQLLGADLGRVILYGIAVSLPMAILGGIIYGGWIAKRMFIPVPAMAIRPEVARPA